jgi:hypothetical protein
MFLLGRRRGPGGPVESLEMAGNAPLEAANFLQHTLNEKLLAQPKFLNDGLVAFGIVCLEVIQQAASLADQHEKTAA